jgi:glutaredoxin
MKVYVYSKKDCPACDQLKNRLKKEGEEYTEIMVGKDITREEFMEMYPQVRSMPHMVVCPE